MEKTKFVMRDDIARTLLTLNKSNKLGVCTLLRKGMTHYAAAIGRPKSSPSIFADERISYAVKEGEKSRLRYAK